MKGSWFWRKNRVKISRKNSDKLGWSFRKRTGRVDKDSVFDICLIGKWKLFRDWERNSGIWWFESWFRKRSDIWLKGAQKPYSDNSCFGVTGIKLPRWRKHLPFALLLGASTSRKCFSLCDFNNLVSFLISQLVRGPSFFSSISPLLTHKSLAPACL